MSLSTPSLNGAEVVGNDTPRTSSNGADLLRAVRQRIDARRRYERLQVAVAILFIAMGLAPLAHELTAAATRPKPKSAAPAANVVKQPTTPAVTAPEPPSLLPLLVALAVMVAGILGAGVLYKELKPWDDSPGRLTRDLERLFEEDGQQQAVWRLVELHNRPADGHYDFVKAALRRHEDEAYPAIAPVRIFFGGLLPLAALLSLTLVACALALRLNLAAVPVAEWASYSKAALGQGWGVLGGAVSPLTLLAVLAISAIGAAAMAVGWLLGRALPAPSADDRIGLTAADEVNRRAMPSIDWSAVADFSKRAGLWFLKMTRQLTVLLMKFLVLLGKFLWEQLTRIARWSGEEWKRWRARRASRATPEPNKTAEKEVSP